MIRSTFVHLSGVGEKTERAVWRAGLLDWAAAAESDLVLPRVGRVARWATASIEALEARDWSFFRGLGGGEAWRWLGELRERAVYLDIETTGLGPRQAETTVVAVYDGQEVRLYVRGENLHDFPLEILGYDLLVTYNGAQFDVPFLRAEFPRLRLPPIHLDLRFPLQRLGYRGGLKGIERATGLVRDEGLAGVDGFLAVLLWRRHLDGDARALPTLLAYAAEDVVGLEPLAELVYNRLSEPLPPPVPSLGPTPRRPVERPFDPSLLAELLRRPE